MYNMFYTYTYTPFFLPFFLSLFLFLYIIIHPPTFSSINTSPSKKTKKGGVFVLYKKTTAIATADVHTYIHAIKTIHQFAVEKCQKKTKK